MRLLHLQWYESPQPITDYFTHPTAPVALFSFLGFIFLDPLLFALLIIFVFVVLHPQLFEGVLRRSGWSRWSWKASPGAGGFWQRAECSCLRTVVPCSGEVRPTALPRTGAAPEHKQMHWCEHFKYFKQYFPWWNHELYVYQKYSHSFRAPSPSLYPSSEMGLIRHITIWAGSFSENFQRVRQSTFSRVVRGQEFSGVKNKCWDVYSLFPQSTVLKFLGCRMCLRLHSKYLSQWLHLRYKKI